MSGHAEILTGLSVEELEALADSLLVPAAQAQLGEMLARQKTQQLSVDEEQQLDRLLRQIDQLTLLKTRARYTLNEFKTTPASTRPAAASPRSGY